MDTQAKDDMRSKYAFYDPNDDFHEPLKRISDME